MTIALLLAVACAGAAGALARYMLDAAIMSRTHTNMAWGTWAVNLSGSFLLGVLYAASSGIGLPDTLRIALGAGFLGAFTTFSTWMVQTMRLIEDRELRLAVLNIVGPMIAGPIAALLGIMIGGWLFG